MADYFVFVGTYSRGTDAEGIYTLRLNGDTGQLSIVGCAGGVENPSFLDVHPQHNGVYAIGEVGDFEGGSSGSVGAFKLDPQTGKLELINVQSSVGSGPCHISVDRTGKAALVANYGSGSVAALPIGADGSLAAASAFIQHQGSSVNPKRQQGPHAHSIVISPDNHFAFAPDLGIDKVMIYKFDAAAGSLTANTQAWVELAPGAGPRHFTFHPNGRYAYVINEIFSTVTAYTYDGAEGRLEEIQTVPTLPADFDGVSHTADIHITPSGKYLYGSNRGHDSLAAFSIDVGSGHLTPLEYKPTGGSNPRNFALDPSGRFLFAANQETGNIVTYRIDEDTGLLLDTGHEIAVPKPVCIKMVPVG